MASVCDNMSSSSAIPVADQRSEVIVGVSVPSDSVTWLPSSLLPLLFLQGQTIFSAGVTPRKVKKFRQNLEVGCHSSACCSCARQSVRPAASGQRLFFYAELLSLIRYKSAIHFSSIFSAAAADDDDDADGVEGSHSDVCGGCGGGARASRAPSGARRGRQHV